jgi:hypothetical protein
MAAIAGKPWFISEIDDDRFSQGLVGLAIEGYTLGEAIAFDFLDITLRAP